MNKNEIAAYLSTITKEQWEAILSLPSEINVIHKEESTESSLIKKVVEEELPKERSEREVDVKVFDILKSMGVPPQVLGYKYLHDAVMLAYSDEAYVHSVTKWLYPELAKISNTTPSKVERAIRHAIQIAFERGDYEVHWKIFKGVYSPLKGTPTNSECIATLAEYIRYN